MVVVTAVTVAAVTINVAIAVAVATAVVFAATMANSPPPPLSPLPLPSSPHFLLQLLVACCLEPPAENIILSARVESIILAAGGAEVSYSQRVLLRV